MSKSQESREDSMWRMERARTHHNARLRREKWCKCCGRAVPGPDFKTKFAAAGGVLAGPFCSSACYWRFISDSWNDTSQYDRRRFYIHGKNDD